MESERRDFATRFQEGNPGGPGRPKGSLSLTTLLKKALQDTKLANVNIPAGQTVAEFFVENMIANASGNSSYMREIMERVDGKVPDATPAPELTMEALVDRLRERKRRLNVEPAILAPEAMATPTPSCSPES
jgi:hypothetical protein